MQVEHKWYQALNNFLFPPFGKGVNTCQNSSSLSEVQRLICNLKQVLWGWLFSEKNMCMLRFFLFFLVLNIDTRCSFWSKESRCTFPGRGRSASRIIWRNPFHLRDTVLLDALERCLNILTLKCRGFLVFILILILRQVCIYCASEFIILLHFPLFKFIFNIPFLAEHKTGCFSLVLVVQTWSLYIRKEFGEWACWKMISASHTVENIIRQLKQTLFCTPK